MINSFVKKLMRVVQPHVEVGGLEISDQRISFFSIHPESSTVRHYSVPLEVGTLNEGVIHNTDAFIRAVVSLKNSIAPHIHRDIPVVVTISDANVFTQTFTLPRFVDGSFREAVRLNMETISPVEFSKSYADWERPTTHDDVSDIEIVSSFVSRSVVDAPMGILQNHGFSVVAIEQRLTSYARFIQQYEASFVKQKSYVLLYVGGDGVSLGILCRGHLYFSKFSSWSVLMKETGSSKELTFSELIKILTREIHQVTNFFISRSRDPIAGVYIASESFGSHIQDSLKDKFPFSVYAVSPDALLGDVSWTISAGAALRGLISRSADTSISLTPEGTRDMLMHSQVLLFMATWRNIFMLVGIVLLMIYSGVYIFLNGIVGSIANDLNTSLTPASVTRFNELKAQAQIFNDAVARAQVVRQQQRSWYDLISGVYQQTGPSVLIDRIFMQAGSSDVTLNAHAQKEEDAISFRRRLETVSMVASVELPLTSIAQVDTNTVTFKLIIRPK